MEKKKIDEISSNVLSYMTKINSISKMVENLVRATTHLGLNKEERKEFILHTTKDIDQAWVLKCLTESEDELASRKK